MVMIGIDAVYMLDTCPSVNALDSWVFCHPSLSNWSPAPNHKGPDKPKGIDGNNALYIAILAPVSMQLILEFYATRALVTDQPHLIIIYNLFYASNWISDGKFEAPLVLGDVHDQGGIEGVLDSSFKNSFLSWNLKVNRFLTTRVTQVIRASRAN